MLIWEVSAVRSLLKQSDSGGESQYLCWGPIETGSSPINFGVKAQVFGQKAQLFVV